MAARTVRLHHPDGKVITEPFTKLARLNGISLNDARRMIDLWVLWGDLVRRKDGGFDVIHFRPRKDPETLAALRDGDGGGTAGIREPRRPLVPAGSASAEQPA